MSGNRWRVQESDTNTGQIPLDGTYIANEVLCAISPSEKTNTVAVEACIVVRKRDFIVTPSGNPLMREFRERVHREKFMSAILAKSLAKQSYQSSSAKDTGRFILSRSTLSMDDDD